MSSREGFPRADVDTGYFHDPKVIALARRQRDPIRTLATLGLHLATILASWSEAKPMSLEEAAPAWFLAELDEYRAELVAVGLLDADGRLTERAFGAWIAPVIEIHEQRAADGRRGAAKRWHTDPTGPANGEANGEANAPIYLPTGRPVLPTDRPAGSATSRPRAGGAVDAAPMNGHVDPPCFRETDPGRPMFRRHQSEHVVLAGGRNACRACEREAAAAAQGAASQAVG